MLGNKNFWENSEKHTSFLVKWQVSRLNWNFAYTQPTYLIFGMVKGHHNIYYCTKNQVRGWCVGGDIAILLRNEPNKWPYLRLRTTHTFDFWYSNRYCDDLSPYQKSGGLCIGGVSIQTGHLHHYWCKCPGPQLATYPFFQKLPRLLETVNNTSFSKSR